MHKKTLVLLFLLALSTSGCFGDRPESITNGKNDTDEFVDAGQLKKGRKLLIIPFQAGEDVEASHELDQVSLMIVKGVVEEFEKLKAPFTVLTVENADSAEFILKGHITQKGESRNLKKWIFINRKIYLGVSIEIVDKKSGKCLLVYSRHRQAPKKTSDFKALGYQLGQTIAHFITTGKDPGRD